MFKPSAIFPVLKSAITPALPPFAVVKRVFGPEDEAGALVSVLTPQGMKPLLKVTLSGSSAGTSWAEPIASRRGEWYAAHWQQWEAIQQDVADRVGAVAAVAWACQSSK